METANAANMKTKARATEGIRGKGRGQIYLNSQNAGPGKGQGDQLMQCSHFTNENEMQTELTFFQNHSK